MPSVPVVMPTRTQKTRTLPIYGDMPAWLSMARSRRDRDCPQCPWVFQVEGCRLEFDWRI
jgi:hypothetical protein